MGEKSTAQRRMNKTKKLHRPSFSLSDWSREYLYGNFHKYREGLNYFDSFQVSSLREVTRTSDPSSSVVQVYDYDEFMNLELLTQPSIIKDIPKRENWSAVHKWPSFLEPESHKYHPMRHRKMKCGEDDDGHKLKVRLKYFLAYMRKNRDDSPLYVFDGNFDNDKTCQQILDEYRVPSMFREDLFNLVSNRRRPPHRWFLIGPERSGTTLHIDPLATAAWNTLICGQKRWVLFPPGTAKRLAKASSFCYRGEDDEASQYFMQMLPRLRRHARKYPDRYPNLQIYEFTQNPGETVFIPNGWWHAVLNLTDTVGVTQNFVSERVANFDDAWLKTRSGRKRMAWKWLLQLKEHYPHLAERALELNKRDNFIMKYDPANHEQTRKKDKEKQKFQRKPNDDERQIKRPRKEEKRNADTP